MLSVVCSLAVFVVVRTQSAIITIGPIKMKRVHNDKKVDAHKRELKAKVTVQMLFVMS